jgi:hypothetical protein
MPAIARRSGPRRGGTEEVEDTVGDRPGRLAAPSRRKGASAPADAEHPRPGCLLQRCRPAPPATAAIDPRPGWPQGSPASDRPKLPRRPQPHAEASAPPELVATDYRVPARTCTRPAPTTGRVEINAAQVYAALAATLLGFRADMAASGRRPESGPAVGALSSLRPPGGTGTAVPVSAQKVSLVRQVLGRCGRKGDSGGGAADLATLHKESLAWRRLPGAAGLGGLWAKWLATQSWPGVVPGPSGRTQSSSFRATAGVSLHGTTS